MPAGPDADRAGNGDAKIDSQPMLNDLIARARTLLAELEAFKTRLRVLRREGNVELGHFRHTVQSELSMLERLESSQDATSAAHVARSSNLPFLETVWNAAKKSRSVIALQKRMYPNAGSKLLSQGMRRVEIDDEFRVEFLGNGPLDDAALSLKAPKSGTAWTTSFTQDSQRERHLKDGAVLVDAVTDEGKTWIKVSLVTNQRLLFDLAKQGWNTAECDEDNFDDPSGPADSDDDCDVPLVRTAKELTAAAQSFRVRTKRPVVRMILPRVQPGLTAEIDAMLEKCRGTGATLICDQDQRSAPRIDHCLSNMAPDPLDSFSDVVNLDCTILLALVSEFSHANVSKEPWFHAALKRQVEIEGNENLLPSLLYPAMGSHRLVTTKEAVKRMREIVYTIGTPSEKARTAILLGDDREKTQADLIDQMQEWSAYEVPRHWRLPLTVVDQNEENCQASLPAQALSISSTMTDINKSVFLYGWATGRTTLTSNRTVVKQIEHDLAKYEDLNDNVWPSIWLCPTARSLVGKEKRGAKKGGTVCRLPDPLRREEHRRNGLDVLSLREGYEVEDRRPDGYPCDEVLAAKNSSKR